MNNTQTVKNSATIKGQIEALNVQTVESLEKWNKMSKKQLIEVASKIKGLNFSTADKKRGNGFSAYLPFLHKENQQAYE